MVCMYVSFAMRYLFTPDAEVPDTGGLKMLNNNINFDNGGGSSCKQAS